ncbi:MAG TPA: UDP-glucose/GDP-mannose dehydrogenase family protein, partial [Verrucomicrobiae bacterium]
MRSASESTPAQSVLPVIAVLGLWHLGCVTAACSAKQFQVIGLDFDRDVIEKLNSGKAPLLEPGLDDLLAAGIASKKLAFTTNPKAACANANVLWVCYDTPVNDDDESDVEFVLVNLRKTLRQLAKHALVLISSQLPVGTCAKLEKDFPQFSFAYSPENLRLGKAIESFENADRVVVGVRDDGKKETLQTLFAPFTRQILFMRTESAEMVKHALNSFLAVSITFINEIARLCEHVGA